jgi:hypothetical protein
LVGETIFGMARSYLDEKRWLRRRERRQRTNKSDGTGGATDITASITG